MNLSNNYCSSNSLFKGKKQIQPEILTRLKEANASYSKSKHYPSYLRSIEEIFNLTTPNSIPQKHLYFFAGFVEGDGSLNVSAKKLASAKFGLVIDPEFSLTQHVSGVKHLHDAMLIFQTGRIRYKTGSDATLVFIIDNRQALEEKVIPFYEKYVLRYSCEAKTQRCVVLKKILEIFKQGGHKDISIFRDEILPLWDSLRMQTGQKNQTFESLKAAQDYIDQNIIGSSETTRHPVLPK